MKIRILGNGGALNTGMPYNSFLLDGSLLVETPPDIVLSLQRENVDIGKIREIFISHLHGDHCFGFPFLVLHLFWIGRGVKLPEKVRVYCPAAASEALAGLVRTAWSIQHPCIGWMAESIEFIEVSPDVKQEMGGCEARFYAMEHFSLTYGFMLYRQNRAFFGYSADTVWCGSLESMLAENPRVFLLDLNGQPNDPAPVHVRESDLTAHGYPRPGGTTFIGTHLKSPADSRVEGLTYAVPGMEFNIQL